MYLGRALDALRYCGQAVPDALLAHVAPLGWQHINLTGDYLWGAETRLDPDGSGLYSVPAAPRLAAAA